ncbi:MAG: hypothetical protein H0V10_11220, partial [Geodermatophilaceae bacterium]|nr:hypothetical protein [Geodermatophilaceae bacterium]
PYIVPPTHETVTIGDNLVSIELQGPGEAVRLGVPTGDRDDWILSNDTVDASGQEVDGLPSWLGDCLPPPTTAGPGEDTAVQDCLVRLADLGYQQRVVYQPADRFWALQWSETALFFGLAGLLAWFCFWWTRRRLT